MAAAKIDVEKSEGTVVELPAEATASINCKIASTQNEREAAFRLIYRSYLRAGLGRPNRFEMRVTPYHLTPTTEIFVARYDREVISTVTLIADGPLGLPLEAVYRTDTQRRREEGTVLGEVSCLADRRQELTRSLQVLVQLWRIMVQTARHRGIEELLVAVHPKHVRFYQRALAFERISDETAYPHANGKPAVALSLNFQRIDRERPFNYDRFFGEPIPKAELDRQPMDPAEREYFRSILARSPASPVF